MFDFANGLFDTGGFVPRASCGNWTPALMWLHIVSDVLIWVAYVSIPLVLLAFSRRKELPFPRIFRLFALFIVSCGSVHFIEAIIFFEPIYRFSGVVKAFTAAVSLLTVAALIPLVRKLFATKPDEFLAVLQAGRARGFGVRGVSVWVTAVWIAAVVVLFANMLVSDRNIRTLVKNEELVTHTWVVKQQLDELMSRLTEAEVGHRGYQITGNGEYLTRYFSGKEATERSLARLTELVADNPAHAPDLTRLEELLPAKFDDINQNIVMHLLHGQGAAREDIRKGHGTRLQEEIRAVVARMDTREDELLAQRALVAKNKHHATTVTNSLGGGLAVGMLFLGYGVITWEFGRRLTAENALKQREAALTRSESELRTITAAVPQIVWVAAANGDREYFNAKWYEYTGFTQEQSLGGGWVEALHPEDKARGAARWKESVQTGREYEIEYRFRSATGEYRWFLGRALPQTDEKGIIVQWFGSCTDITERKEAEEAVRRSERNLADFFDNANIGLHCVDARGIIIRANRAELEMLGYTEHEYVGQPIEAFHVDLEAIAEMMRRLKSGEKLHNYPARLRCKDGTTRDVLISSSVLWESGRFVHTRTFTRDVTEQKRAEASIAEQGRAAALRADVAIALNSAGETGVTLQACVDTLVRHAEVASARIWLTDASEKWLELQATAGTDTGTDETSRRVRVGESKIGRVASTAELYITNDLPNDPNTSSPALTKRENFLAFAGYPLIVDNRVLGVVSIFSRQTLSQNAIDDLRPVVASIAQYVQRQRAEDAIRTSEERFRTLTEAIPQIVWNATGDGEVSYLNHRWLEYTELPIEEIRGRGWLAAAHPVDQRRVAQAWENTLSSAAAGVVDRFRTEVRLRRGDTGEFRWFLTVAVPLYRPDGTIDQWIGSMADIHDQKMAAEVIRESEEKFRQLAESIPQLAWMTDADGYIFWYNQRWYDYTGTTFQQMKGWGWQAVHDPAELPRVLAKFKAHIASGEPWEDTFPIRRHDGEMRWHLSRARPIRDDNGRIVRWFGTNTDITAQRELEQRLRAGEERFRTLTEALPLIVWTANPTGKVTFLNRRWGAFTGQELGANQTPHKELFGDWGDLVHPEDASQLTLAWERAVADQPEQFTEEFRLKHAADGTHRWMLSTAIPLRDETGSVTEWVGSITDIDDQKRQAEILERLVRHRTAALVDEIEERRRAEQRVREVAAELSRSNAELEQFAYVASHDLQEPLRKIQAFGDRLRNRFHEHLPDGGKDYVDRMLSAAGRMRQLIDDLLTFSRVTTQSRPSVRLDMGKLVREVLSDLSVRIENSKGEVRIGELPEIEGDPTQMRQLFQNLIANAVKFHRPGVPPIVEVSGELILSGPSESNGPAAPYCRFTVRDNGIGFDPKYLGRLFQVFQRLHGRDEYEGTGVGLAICRKITERHGGTITAVSRVGEGATFIVTLPIQQAHPVVTGPKNATAGDGY